MKRVVIKEELVALTGDSIAAVILNQFLYWSERRRDFDDFIREERDRDSSVKVRFTHGWIYKSVQELSGEIMINASEATLRRRLKCLVRNRWLDERNNPDFGWDRTLQYRPNLRVIQRDLMTMGYSLDGYPLPEDFDTLILHGEECILHSEDSISHGGDSMLHGEGAIPEITTEITAERQDNFSDLFAEKATGPATGESGLRERLKAGKLTGDDLAKALGLTAAAREDPDGAACGLFAECWGVWTYPAASHREKIIWEEFSGELLDRCGGDLDGARNAIAFYFRSPDWEDSVSRITTPKGALNALVKIHHEEAWRGEQGRAKHREPLAVGLLFDKRDVSPPEPNGWDKWPDVLAEVSRMMTRATFSAYLAGSRAVLEDGTLTVYTGKENTAEFLTHRLSRRVAQAVIAVTGEEAPEMVFSEEE